MRVPTGEINDARRPGGKANLSAQQPADKDRPDYAKAPSDKPAQRLAGKGIPARVRTAADRGEHQAGSPTTLKLRRAGPPNDRRPPNNWRTRTGPPNDQRTNLSSNQSLSIRQPGNYAPVRREKPTRGNPPNVPLPSIRHGRDRIRAKTAALTIGR